MRFIHSPPKNALHPRKNQLIKNVRVTWEMLQPNSLDRGIRKTLHAYAAPKAICKHTPATAIHQRFNTRIIPPLASSGVPARTALTNQAVRYNTLSMLTLGHASYVTSVWWSTPPRARVSNNRVGKCLRTCVPPGGTTFLLVEPQKIQSANAAS